ncbi:MULTISPECIES: DUF2283 domain-containing protein [unclassified Marinitoga]|uniref:DUF2283 domain-containing protein n=1 Tax=unclassified Marinitoga TaxID=2640159 RepID=UPI0006414EDA|nr:MULTISPECIES: DUF2283 domain-containing protein [unclassified Marinitoga]KLO24773.1 hypothetical protein X274_02105 [Marinitoga sp. 1155]NUU99250.1 hypothetical protein [Marinitoga sp. 1154]
MKNKYGYSPKGDVVYIKLKDSKSKYGDMIDDNIVLFFDDDTDEIVGIEILSFKKTLEKGNLERKLKNYNLNIFDDLKKIYSSTNIS